MYVVDGAQYYERPVNSGNLWYPNNQPAGRVELEFNDQGHIVSKKFDHTAPHKDYVAPLHGAEKVHFELEQARMKNAELAAELAQIRKEREPVREETTAPTAPKKAAPALKPTGV